MGNWCFFHRSNTKSCLQGGRLPVIYGGLSNGKWVPFSDPYSFSLWLVVFNRTHLKHLLGLIFPRFEVRRKKYLKLLITRWAPTMYKYGPITPFNKLASPALNSTISNLQNLDINMEPRRVGLVEMIFKTSF